MVNKMLDTIAWQRQTPQWLENGGVFIPHLSTWINQERYDDEPFEVPQMSAQSARLLRLVNE
ncbi:MAG: hypothetical protein EBU23_03350 [Mycobacteriaceae bacterium]|nr:hypothetical protein [Mycobacteriaceae bacterium]NBQ41611.1 hypothetical protein [Mycobacteriaceae bacterium]